MGLELLPCCMVYFSHLESERKTDAIRKYIGEKTMKLAFFDEISDFIFADDEPQPADIIFIPGNGYAQMAELAASLYKRGLAPYLMPSGKYAIGSSGFSDALIRNEAYKGSFRTEWEFLENVLVKNGVPREAILKEDEATYTWQNAQLSRQVLEEAGWIPQKAIICARAVHSRRCLLYYSKAFPETRFYVCTTAPDGITRENWYATRQGIDAVMGEMNRIVSQFSLWMD